MKNSFSDGNEVKLMSQSYESDDGSLCYRENHVIYIVNRVFDGRVEIAERDNDYVLPLLVKPSEITLTVKE